ncbi:MAG: hypothetical protein WD512_00445 [Candidatus Paceibacterota bacterium]
MKWYMKIMLRYTDAAEVCAITKKSIPIMIESFKHGTRFVLPNIEYDPKQQIIGKVFKARVAHSVGLSHFKVTNDERRRLLPILHDLAQKMKACN